MKTWNKQNKQETENLWNRVFASVYVRKHVSFKRYLFNVPRATAVAHKTVAHKEHVHTW